MCVLALQVQAQGRSPACWEARAACQEVGRYLVITPSSEGSCDALHEGGMVFLTARLPAGQCLGPKPRRGAPILRRPSSSTSGAAGGGGGGGGKSFGGGGGGGGSGGSESAGGLWQTYLRLLETQPVRAHYCSRLARCRAHKYSAWAAVERARACAMIKQPACSHMQCMPPRLGSSPVQALLGASPARNQVYQL